MPESDLSGSDPEVKVFLKDAEIVGRPIQIQCVEIENQRYVLRDGFLKTVELEDPCFEDVKDPECVIRALRGSTHIKADIFTFRQRVPDLKPQYPYYQEWENIAVLPVSGFDEWLSKAVGKGFRRNVRISEKKGVEVRETVYDDEFVRGMTGIFNETPVRQGRPFTHYGKDFETVKRQFARYIHREIMIGTYFEGELIGFIMLGIGDRIADPGQIISYMKHRDKNPNNALMAKAVEICKRKKVPYLLYGEWTDDSLSAFKEHCGFQKTALPRYYIPLTLKGKLALAFRLHKGFKKLLPRQFVVKLKKVKKLWYVKKSGRE